MGTQNIKAQVHLVKTNNPSSYPFCRGLIVKSKKDWTPIGEKAIKAGTLSYCVNDSASVLNYYTPQHLYFITDEEIKDGNLYLSDVNNAVCKWTQHYSATNGYGRKIIATTNPELWDKSTRGQEYLGGGTYVRTFNREKGIAKIDTPFIEAYIKTYSEGNPIKEVLLETEEYAIGSYGLSDGEPIIDTRLKLRPNGSVITHPIKERMYSEEQVRRMLIGFKATNNVGIARIKEVEDYMNAYYPN